MNENVSRGIGGHKPTRDISHDRVDGYQLLPNDVSGVRELHSDVSSEILSSIERDKNDNL